MKIIFSRPKRYKLADLVDWFMRILRREADEAGYRRLDIDYCPLFKLKVTLTEKLSPAYPVGYLHWQALERVSIFHNNNFNYNFRK